MSSRASSGSLGPALRRLRERRGWSQAQMAECLGIRVQNLSNLERGIRDVSVAKAVDFARRLDEDPRELVGLALQRFVDDAGLDLDVVLRTRPRRARS